MASIEGSGPGAALGSRIVWLCLLAAIFEGIDIQSMGVAAPKLAPEFHLRPVEVGYALSGSILGLMIGAAAGGRLADRLGPKRVMLGSLLLLGIFSLATTQAWDMPSLVALRVLAGLGLGGLLPSLISIVTKASNQQARATSLALVYAGMPIGGAIVGAVAALLAQNPDWRPIFYLGGFGPLLIVPLLAIGLPRTVPGRDGADRRTGTVSQVLFGKRLIVTAMLWIAYFCTLLVVYLLLNWLPSLLVGKGYSRPEALAASMILNLGAVFGSVCLGALIDRDRIRLAVLLTYVGIGLSLAILAFSRGPAIFFGAFIAGFFAVGGQLVLYALAPIYYPAANRGTGVGASVAVGRLGSILGPIMAGELLSRGFNANAVLLAAAPSILVAAGAVLVLRTHPAAS